MTGAVAVLVHYELALYVAALALVASAYLIWHAQRIERSQLLWIVGLSIVGLICLGLLVLYALPQKARLPEETVTARFLTGPVSLVGGVQGWLLQTVEVVRFLYGHVICQLKSRRYPADCAAGTEVVMQLVLRACSVVQPSSCLLLKGIALRHSTKSWRYVSVRAKTLELQEIIE
jgi:hypothetical protein